MTFSQYFNSPYKQYQDFIEQSILSYELPQNSYRKIFLGESFHHNPIFSYTIGKGDFPILITGGIHGREAINSFALLSLLDHYASHFTCYAQWFTEHTLTFLPMVNPDGYLKSLEQPLFKNNGRNVDLNRNFPCKLWKEKWNGDHPASEVETQLLMEVFHNIKPDIYFDIHSRGKGIYYYRNTMLKEYNEHQLFLAKKLSNLTGYELYSPELEINPNDSGGNTVQYFAETFQKPAFTIETVPDTAPFPLSSSYLPEIFEQLVSIILLF